MNRKTSQEINTCGRFYFPTLPATIVPLKWRWAFASNNWNAGKVILCEFWGQVLRGEAASALLNGTFALELWGPTLEVWLIRGIHAVRKPRPMERQHMGVPVQNLSGKLQTELTVSVNFQTAFRWIWTSAFEFSSLRSQKLQNREKSSALWHFKFWTTELVSKIKWLFYDMKFWSICSIATANGRVAWVLVQKYQVCTLRHFLLFNLQSC